MPIGTADQFRTRPILVTVAGSDLQIECCKPDPLDLIARDLLPLDIFSDVIEAIAKWNQTPNDGSLPALNRELADVVLAHPKAWADLMDRWVCAAAVKPRVVLTEAEAAADPTALWIEDLDYETKTDIFGRTNARLRKSPRVGAAVKEFRRLQPGGVGAGSDRPAVRDAAVGVAGDAGSAARA